MPRQVIPFWGCDRNFSAPERQKVYEVDMTRVNSEKNDSMSGGDCSSEVVPGRRPPSLVVNEDVLFVALGKDFKENQSVLMYAVEKSRARGLSICLVHVHQPAQKIPVLGTKVPISIVPDYQVKEYHEREREEMHKILDNHTQTCELSKVRAKKLLIEMGSIEQGIVHLISEHGIKWLVMGAAANKSYSRKMKGPKSKKAIHVCQVAPSFCQIWFVCRGELVYTRESRFDGVNTNKDHPSFLPSPSTVSVRSAVSLPITEGKIERTHLREFVLESRFLSDSHITLPSTLSACSGSAESLLITEGKKDRTRLQESGLERRFLSDNHIKPSSNLSKFSGSAAPCSIQEESINPSVDSRFSTSSSEIIEDSASVSFPKIKGGGDQAIRDPHHSFVASGVTTSIAPQLEEGDTNDEIYAKIEQYLAEAESLQNELHVESIRRKKAEKDVIDAIRRVKASETMYSQELLRRKEIEKSLLNGHEETEKVKGKLEEVMEELRISQEHKSSLESQIAKSDGMIEELKQKLFSAVEMLQRFKKERDELQVAHDDALHVAEDLMKRHSDDPSVPYVSQFFSEFSFSDIEDATSQFNSSLKIDEGGYGCIYKGNLRHTQVAIKLLNPNIWQGPSEFQQEVRILSQLRHPNIVTLIGACPETWALIYEYLPNGNLEDRLDCNDNAPPLPWQTRIRIAAELCSALIFLHSCCPRGVIHGDLKPTNILLDANFVCKLSDFRTCRVLSADELADNNLTMCCKTSPKGTFDYVDPEFLTSGELTSKSDVYSFGIILLRLLTGMPALGIVKEVQCAIDEENLKNILDPTAGDWPFVQAKQLAHLALSCVDLNHKRRPDLCSEVWRVLQPMKVSCGAPSSQLGPDERSHIPSYFVCPIFQEVMQDPVVSADGFTYEAEALKGWFESGHDTSPMTNLKLPNRDVVPNHSLRSAIQEWLQQD